ncbi:MAG: TetR/AcrR family transcriptional regulator [Roseovarius sp.]
MAGKREERREALRKTLVDIAEARVVQDGAQAVKARELAKEAGCALGAIYNVFEDLTHIVLDVNGRSFRLLGQDMRSALNEVSDDTPTDQLIAIAEAYLTFAMTQTNRWRSLFEVPFSPDLEIPQWYWHEMDTLFSLIAGPVERACPDLTAHDQALMTKALFSSVQGIISFGIENRTSPVPQADLRRMITLIVTRTTGNS